MKININEIIKNGKIDEVELEKLAMEKPLLVPITEDKLMRFSIKENRDREQLPERLPTFGLLPMPVDEHEHIGMYESKQNIYLTLAHAFNKAMDRIEALEKEVENLKK
jgi:hypothetical protein